MGKYSAIENRYLTRLSIKIWKLFADDLDLSEAKEQSFKSLQACFIRELQDGLRPIVKDSAVVTSPCDAIIGAFGTINQGRVFQAKGFPYSLQELVLDHELVKPFERGHPFVISAFAETELTRRYAYEMGISLTVFLLSGFGCITIVHATLLG